MTEDQEQIDLEPVKTAARELMKQFDAVQIFAVRHEGSNGTVNVRYGLGNIFARYGLTNLWCKDQKLDLDGADPE